MRGLHELIDSVYHLNLSVNGSLFSPKSTITVLRNGRVTWPALTRALSVTVNGFANSRLGVHTTCLFPSAHFHPSLGKLLFAIRSIDVGHTFLL